MKINLHLVIFTNLNSKIEGLNVRPKTTTFLEENTGRKLLDTDLGNSFLGDAISKV